MNSRNMNYDMRFAILEEQQTLPLDLIDGMNLEQTWIRQ